VSLALVAALLRGVSSLRLTLSSVVRALHAGTGQRPQRLLPSADAVAPTCKPLRRLVTVSGASSGGVCRDG